MIGPQGGFLQGDANSPLQGFNLTIPPGAFEKDALVRATLVPSQEFEDGLLRMVYGGSVVGPVIDITTDGVLLKPANLTLPYDPALVSAFDLMVASSTDSVYELELGGDPEDADANRAQVGSPASRPEKSNVSAFYYRSLGGESDPQQKAMSRSHLLRAAGV